MRFTTTLAAAISSAVLAFAGAANSNAENIEVSQVVNLLDPSVETMNSQGEFILAQVAINTYTLTAGDTVSLNIDFQDDQRLLLNNPVSGDNAPFFFSTRFALNSVETDFSVQYRLTNVSVSLADAIASPTVQTDLFFNLIGTGNTQPLSGIPSLGTEFNYFPGEGSFVEFSGFSTTFFIDDFDHSPSNTDSISLVFGSEFYEIVLPEPSSISILVLGGWIVARRFPRPKR